MKSLAALILDYLWLPEWLLLRVIRSCLHKRVAQQWRRHQEKFGLGLVQLVNELKQSAAPAASWSCGETCGREPGELYQLLGSRRWLGPGYWEEGVGTNAEAADAFFALMCRRAGLVDGSRVLELGGSAGVLAQWIAKHYPSCELEVHIRDEGRCDWLVNKFSRRGLRNVKVVPENLAAPQKTGRFDFIFVNCLIERRQNLERLLETLSAQLAPKGKVLFGYFCHRRFLYFSDASRGGYWLQKHFLRDWLMPCEDLLLYFQRDLGFVKQWRLNGRHYRRTLESYLEIMQSKQRECLLILGKVYGRGKARLWYRRWRLFLLIAKELFSYQQGREWYYSQILMEHLPAKEPESAGS